MSTCELDLFQHPRVPVTYAVFYGSVPSRKQLEVIQDRELGLSFRGLPPEYFDLSRLVRDAPRIKHLSVIGARCRDATPLKELESLTSLMLTIDQSVDVDITEFRALELFWGDHKHFESVRSCTTLKSLALQGTVGTALDYIAGPVEYLELIDARTLRELPVFRHPEALTTAWILGSKHINLSRVGAFSSLEELSLQSCKKVSAADELAGLGRLKTLGLLSCNEIEPKEALLELAGVNITVADRNPFDAEFRVRAERASSSWAYFGSARGSRTPDILD